MTTDPTRIDHVLEAVRLAWEGQPQLSLPTLFAQLALDGVGWGATDDQLVDALRQLAAVHPPLLPAGAGMYLAQLDSPLPSVPGTRVTLAVDGNGGGTAVVRRFDAKGMVQPVVWKYAAARPVGPGRPLVLTDADGFEHRLGVVAALSRLEPAALRRAQRPLTGLRRRSLGDRVYVLRLRPQQALKAAADASAAAGASRDGREASTTIVLDHGLHVFSRRNRSVERQDVTWQEILSGAMGEPLRVRSAGGVEMSLGEVFEVHVAEAEIG